MGYIARSTAGRDTEPSASRSGVLVVVVVGEEITAATERPSNANIRSPEMTKVSVVVPVCPVTCRL